MTSALWNKVKEHGDFRKYLKMNKGNTVEFDDSRQTYPTESAEKAKEKKKANELAGIKSKRRPVHVEHRFGDLSGLGAEIAFLTADTELTDASDPDSDVEASVLVHNWFGNQTMQARNAYDLIPATTSLQST